MVKPNLIVDGKKWCAKGQHWVEAPAGFNRDRSTASDLASCCKNCQSAQDARYYEHNAAKKRAAYRAWYAEHREERAEYTAEWFRKNAAHRREYNARYYAKNKETMNAAYRRWAKENPEKRLAKENRRRAIKAAVEVGDVDYAAIWERDGGVCHVCGERVTLGEHHFDHVIPLSRGGEHSMENIAVAHATCNLKKGAKLMEDLAHAHPTDGCTDGVARAEAWG